MRRVQCRFAWPVLILVLAACSPKGETRAPDQGTGDQVSAEDPTSAVDGYYTGFNAGDIQALESVLFEDLDISINFLGRESKSTGREAYLHQEAASFAAGAQVSYSNPRISGNTFQAEHTYQSEGLLLSGTIEFVVEGGQIVSIDIQITQSGTADEHSEMRQEPVGTPIGPATQLASLDPGWTALAPGGETFCALGTPYSFWVRPGSSEELLIHLQGGGYCDSAENCAPGTFFYDSEVAANDSPVIHPTGIFDLDNPENPFGDHSMVFIPYCTGDTHMGGNVEVYAAEDGTELTVHHVGYANVSSALDWIYDNFEQPSRSSYPDAAPGALDP